MHTFKIVVLENEDILKFNALFYDELLLELPDDAIALGAIDTGSKNLKAVGILVFHIREGIAFIDWLYVDDEHRLKGVGTALIDSLKEAIIQIEDEAEVDSISLSFTQNSNGLGVFLRKNGFAVAFGLGNYNVVAALQRVRLIGARESANLKAVPLNMVPESSFAEFDNYLNVIDDIIVGVESPITVKNYRKESHAIMEGGKIVAVMLVSDTMEENMISIDWVYAMPKYMIHAIPLAFDTVISELKKNCSERTILNMASLSPSVEGIIRKTMPGAIFTEIDGAMWIR